MAEYRFCAVCQKETIQWADDDSDNTRCVPCGTLKVNNPPPATTLDEWRIRAEEAEVDRDFVKGVLDMTHKELTTALEREKLLWKWVDLVANRLPYGATVMGITRKARRCLAAVDALGISKNGEATA